MSDGPTAPLEIRSARDTDHAAWLELWRGYQRFYNIDIPDAATAETWTRFSNPAEPIWAALAWRGGVAVGLVHWIFHRSTWTTTDYCYLQDLFVAPAVRGGGVGRALIEHVYGEADRAGSPRVYWLTHETNRQAMVLYDRVAAKSGFVHYWKRF